MSSPQTTPDLEAVARAIREHDRFLVTTHENPDGDALGSLLATKLALESLGKDVVTWLYGDAPLPDEYEFMALDDLVRELPTDSAERVLLAVDCANASRIGPGLDVVQRAPLTIDVDHHHDNTRFGDVNLIVSRASSTGEVLRDVLRGARRRADPGDRGGALHRARDRHGALPVHEHLADARCGWRPSWSRPARTSTASSRPSTRRSTSRSSS